MQKLKVKRTKRKTITETEIVEYQFFSEPSGRTAAVEAHQNPDNNKSEIVIAVTISQVRKGLTQQNPFVAPLL